VIFMTTRGRALRFTAVSALVVLSLTGFSTGRHGHGGDGSGGGCSSSGQDHDSSSSTSGGGDAYKDDDTYGDDTYGDGTYGDDTYGDDSGSGGSGEAEAEPAVLNLITCVREDQPWSTVEVTNPNATEYTLAVTVLFKDADGTTIDEGTEEVTVPADGVSAVRVPFDGSGIPDHCEVSER
jgi:hypothetical protein